MPRTKRLGEKGAAAPHDEKGREGIARRSWNRKFPILDRPRAAWKPVLMSLVGRGKVSIPKGHLEIFMP